jgi:hypothetical protein
MITGTTLGGTQVLGDGGRLVHASGPYKPLDPPRIPVDPAWSPAATVLS